MVLESGSQPKYFRNGCESTNQPPCRTQPEEPVVLDFGARAQDFLKRITPSLCRSRSPRPHAYPGPPETLQNLQSRSPRSQSPLHPCHRQARLSKYRKQNPGRGTRSLGPLVLRPRKMRSGQRFSYLVVEPEETHALNDAYHQRIHRDQSNLIPLGCGGFHPTSSRNSWPATATSKKAWAWIALAGCRHDEVFF
jgi:hypothetical protein